MRRSRRRSAHLEHGYGVGQRGAPAPPLCQSRVAGVGERAVAEIGSDENTLGVDPHRCRSGFLDAEAVGVVLERQRFEVELAHHDGVGAAAGQADQRQVLLGAQHLAPDTPSSHPRGRRARRRRRGSPIRGCRAGTGPRGPPPQPAHMVGVAPEVVEVLPAAARVGDARVGVEDRANLRLQLLERGVPAKSATVLSLCSRTQARASSPVTSSSQRWGSSDGWRSPGASS